MKKFTAILLIFTCFACSKKPTQTAPQTSRVQVAKAIQKDVPYYLSTVGHMEPYQFVNIMAQVSGELIKKGFEDGADIREGDLLYVIDQRPYVAALEKAEGLFEESFAKLGFAERTAERNSELVKDEYISQNSFDSLITNVLTDDALVKQAQADVETAKINLGYTTITSPISARAGATKVYVGDVILEQAKQTLVTLNQITPIYSVFYVNGKHLPAIQKHTAREGALKVEVSVEDPSIPPYIGTLSFIDNEIDLSTGMILLKGTHPNENKALWPNQYVRVKVILDILKNATLVPTQAVQDSPKGKFVYVAKGNQTVEKRNVITGQLHEDETIVITKGVSAGEKIVTVGQMNLYPGAKIQIIEGEGDA